MVRDDRAQRFQLDDFVSVVDDLRLVEDDDQVSAKMNRAGARDYIDAGAVANRRENVNDDARLVENDQRRRSADSTAGSAGKSRRGGAVS